MARGVIGLLRSYLAERRSAESFQEFCARQTDGELRAFLAGQEMVAVARDVPTDRPPHGVDG